LEWKIWASIGYVYLVCFVDIRYSWSFEIYFLFLVYYLKKNLATLYLVVVGSCPEVFACLSVVDTLFVVVVAVVVVVVDDDDDDGVDESDGGGGGGGGCCGGVVVVIS
jgi:hypothetical protein